MDWQHSFVGMIVLSAAGYVVRQTWLAIAPATKPTGCGAGCGSCQSHIPGASNQGFIAVEDLVPLTELPRTRKE